VFETTRNIEVEQNAYVEFLRSAEWRLDFSIEWVWSLEFLFLFVQAKRKEA
jgi:hypothetical protein